MSILNYITSQAPEGDFHIIYDESGTAIASGFGSIEKLTDRLPSDMKDLNIKFVKKHPYKQLVEQYFNGDVTALDKIPRKQSGSNFQKQIWRAISKVSYGRTISYKELAEKTGNPAAIRAAGTVCGLNRLILLIPCHRILRSDGQVGSYLYGSDIKESLLRREKAID